MKIKYKILAIAASSILFLIFTTYVIFNFTYFGYINTNQTYQINRSFDVINYLLQKEQESMKSTAIDWSHWDDTYTFINDSNNAYIDSNLEYNTLESLNLKMMLFLNSEGKVIYDNHPHLQDDIAYSLAQNLLLKDDLLKKLISFSGINNIKTGLLRINGKTFILAVSPITTSDRLAPPNGALILVREIDNKLLDYVQKVANVRVNFHGHLYKDTTAKTYGFLNINLIKDPSSIPSSGDCILKDINGNPSIVLSVFKYDSNYTNILYYFKTFIISFLIIIAFICLIDSLIIQEYIFKRLSQFIVFMNTVATTKDTTLSINMSGHDEFNKLANAANKMLNTLNLAYKDIQDMSNRFKMSMEATNDGYLDFNIPHKDLYISPEWKEMIGYTAPSGTTLFNDYLSSIHPDYLEHLKLLYPSIMNGHSDHFRTEYRVIKKSGEIIWVLHRGKIIEKDESGFPMHLVSTLTNITELKAHEEKIMFLSYSDKLTGLKNRAYMENQFDELDKVSNSKYFIIMGDLNGLKLTNDALGHKEGDRLIYIASTILKESCSSDDIVSRWGGDEFIILAKGKDKQYISHLISTVRDRCAKVSDFHFKISMALGYAEKNAQYMDTQSVMSLAEKRMYRNKLMESKSARSATISSLSRTLHEKHSETEEHTMRIRNLGLQLGQKLSLSQDQLDELELLALLHDIGKIGIPDHILMKPDKLTHEEWHIMKTHTEIGYRIAQSTPELSHISDEILAHHEKFDGTGYPNGLKGDAIPILSRIINIVDSFDVMTHSRVYKDASNFDYAINELKQCSGTQFDPFIAHEFLDLLQEKDIINQK